MFALYRICPVGKKSSKGRFKTDVVAVVKWFLAFPLKEGAAYLISGIAVRAVSPE